MGPGIILPRSLTLCPVLSIEPGIPGPGRLDQSEFVVGPHLVPGLTRSMYTLAQADLLTGHASAHVGMSIQRMTSSKAKDMNYPNIPQKEL